MGQRARRLGPGEEKRVVDAIRRAERGSRGEVRVHVEARCKGDALARARDVFEELGMAKTADGTGVLLYVATADQKVAVFAGPGIHAGASPDAWREVVGAVAERAKDGDLAAGLEAGLGRVGEILRARAPGGDHAGDELPNVLTTESRLAGAP